MRWARVPVIAVLVYAALAPSATAQERRVEIAKRGWLGFSPVFSPNPRAGLEVRAVSDDSPADRAGIQPGDTVLKVNGLRATPQLVMSLGSSLEPGDTVRLRLRRDGHTRALTLEAAERSVRFLVAGDDRHVLFFSPDTLRRRLRILTDSLRVHADTFRMPKAYFHWQGDGERFRAGWMSADSMREMWDSLASSHFPPPLEPPPLPGFAAFGMRGVAGAELTELTPGLARVFKTRNGVLVLRVPDDTPARRAGLAEADVIVRANGTDIGSVPELRRLIARTHRASEPARLEVVRDGKRVVLVLRRR